MYLTEKERITFLMLCENIETMSALTVAALFNNAVPDHTSISKSTI